MSHEDLKKAEDTTVKTGSGVPNLIRVEGSGASTEGGDDERAKGESSEGS
jgi:hypothetical protein